MEGRHYPYVSTTIPRERIREMKFDARYFCRPPGMLKCTEIILGISCFIIVIVSVMGVYAIGVLCRAFSLISSVISLIILILYVYHAVEYFYRIPWLKIELVIYLTLSIFYLILAALCTNSAEIDDGFTAISVFAYLGTLAYLIDAILKIVHIRSGEPAQGDYTSNIRRISEFV